MPLNITYSDFEKLYNQKQNQLVWKKIPSDCITAVSALLKLEEKSEYFSLFESVIGGEKRGRYSIIATNPDIIWKCDGYKAYKNFGAGFLPESADAFTSLRSFAAESKIPVSPNLPPMASGIFGFMSYDMVRLMEKLPDANPKNIGIPESVYFRPQTIIIFDNLKDDCYIVSQVYSSEKSAEQAYKNATKNISEVEDILSNQTIPNSKSIVPNELNFTASFSRPQYDKVIEKAKEYIVAGDIFQIVPSRRFTSDFNLPPTSFYRSLRNLNPSPYLFYLKLNGFYIIGSSPEILVRLKDKKVTIRPIAGTRKRGKTEAEDLSLEAELLADGKEISEHLMLLDLGRNDVGRVAKPGTVKVTENMIVERYSHVMHIVSNVEGEIAEGKDFLDALSSGFPAGTVSGAPKIRAMEIIDDLEQEKREFYAGTVGYIAGLHEMDTCITLRTALIKDGKIYAQAGGGVVADSNPEAEFMETENKAGAIIQAAINAKNYL
jgi:anthranilate synthase component 1